MTVGGHFHIIRNGRLRVFSCFVRFLVKNIGVNSEKRIVYGVSSGSQIDKPQRGRPKRAKQPDVDINTGAQSINTERASLKPSIVFSSQKPF